MGAVNKFCGELVLAPAALEVCKGSMKGGPEARSASWLVAVCHGCGGGIINHRLKERQGLRTRDAILLEI